MGTTAPGRPSGGGQDLQPQPPGVVTQKTIADYLGLDQSTISRALRGVHEHLPAETLARIQAAAAELGYDPACHASARRLALRRRGKNALNHVLAFIGPRVTGARYFSEIFWGVSDAASSANYAVLALTPDQPPQRFALLPPVIVGGETDGLVLMNARTSLVEELRAAPGFGDRPLVTLFGILPGCGAVYSDDSRGAYESARHLLNLGHRHLLYLSYHDMLDPTLSLPSLLRYEGMVRACRELGLDPEACLQRSFPYHNWMEPTRLPSRIGFGLSREEARDHPFIHFLRERPEITALLGINDACALHAWHILHSAGLRIPEDMSLVGFDDVDPMLGPGRENLLSSVRIPLEDIGREAVRMVLGMLQGELPPDSHTVFPTTYTPRRSVGPARQGPIP